jgi:hypothetical protein
MEFFDFRVENFMWVYQSAYIWSFNEKKLLQCSGVKKVFNQKKYTVKSCDFGRKVSAL